MVDGLALTVRCMPTPSPKLLGAPPGDGVFVWGFPGTVPRGCSEHGFGPGAGMHEGPRGFPPRPGVGGFFPFSTLARTRVASVLSGQTLWNDKIINPDPGDRMQGYGLELVSEADFSMRLVPRTCVWG